MLEKIPVWGWVLIVIGVAIIGWIKIKVLQAIMKKKTDSEYPEDI